MDKKLVLSKMLTVLFAFFAVCMAIAGPWIVELVCAWYPGVSPHGNGRVLLWTGYVCAAIALVTLYLIYRLLSAISRGEVFSAANVKRIYSISWLCAAAGAISMVDFAVTGLLFLAAVGLSALFMALIVCVVGDAFNRALKMKGELDLTI